MPSRRLHGSSAVSLALFALAGIWLLLGMAGAAMPVPPLTPHIIRRALRRQQPRCSFQPAVPDSAARG